MKLLGTLTSPYVRKVRVVLAEKKIDFEWVLDSPNNPDSLARRINPLARVPVLVLDDETPIFDSPVIVDYLDNLAPNNTLLPKAHRERIEVKRWEALADGLLDAAILVRLENTFEGRKPSERSQAWIDRQMDKVHASLKAMAQGLGDKPFCSGIHLSLSDIAVGCALGWLEFRFPEIGWRAEYPNLAKLMDKLAQRASFADTKPA